MIVGRAFYFGCFMLDPARLLLLRNGEPVTLTPKSFDTLRFLIEHRERSYSVAFLIHVSSRRRAYGFFWSGVRTSSWMISRRPRRMNAPSM